MIKLTNAGPRGGHIWVAPAHIAVLHRLGEYTEVITAGYVASVMETPEQIMAMPEMVYQLFPAMTLSSYSQANGSPFFGPR